LLILRTGLEIGLKRYRFKVKIKIKTNRIKL